MSNLLEFVFKPVAVGGQPLFRKGYNQRLTALDHIKLNGHKIDIGTWSEGTFRADRPDVLTITLDELNETAARALMGRAFGEHDEPEKEDAAEPKEMSLVDAVTEKVAEKLGKRFFRVNETLRHHNERINKLIENSETVSGFTNGDQRVIADLKKRLHELEQERWLRNQSIGGRP